MVPHQIKITKYSHFFKCEEIGPNVLPTVYQFSKRFVKLDQTRSPDPKAPPQGIVFAMALKDRSEFRFHINTIPIFLELLKINGVREHHIRIIQEEVPDADVIDAEMLAKWELRDYQIPVVEYLVDDTKTFPGRFVGIQTGQGKSLSAVAALIRMKVRWITIVKPMYMVKWVEDIVKYTDIKVGEVMAISGSKELKKFCELCLMEGGLDDIKAIIISNATMRMWIEAYEDYGKDTLEMGWSFPPEELYKHAKCGARLIDEIHQDFHLNFRLDLYTNVKRTISLSATFVTLDPILMRMYEIMHPLKERFVGGPLIKYTKSFGVIYNLERGRKVKTTEFKQTSYSHIAYEKSIIRNFDMFNNYCHIVKVMLDIGYFRNHKPGNKAVVFAATKDMCGKFVQYFQKKYPNLDIRRYVDEDPYSNLMEPDIRFTTVLSAGTAHDIPQLTCAILTIALKSIQQNIQAFGRLRKIADQDTNFFFLSCADIPKHMNYHWQKVDLMKERALSYSQIPYQFYV